MKIYPFKKHILGYGYGKDSFCLCEIDRSIKFFTTEDIVNDCLEFSDSLRQFKIILKRTC